MITVTQDPRNRKVFININNISKATRRGMRQGFFQLGNDLVKTASRQILEKPKGGITRRVRRGKTIRRHTASAPGESPANLSGAYRRSLGYKIHGSSRMEFGAGNSSVPYAEFLENGTKNMKPRPGLGNAIRATERNAVQYFINNIKREMRR